MTRLTLHLLGPPRVELDAQEARISRRKALALLAYLAVTGQNHTRDALATLFWPEQDQSRARNSLRSALVSLRRALRDEWLEADRESVSLCCPVSLGERREMQAYAEHAEGAPPALMR